jgi:hypothetical protein
MTTKSIQMKVNTGLKMLVVAASLVFMLSGAACVATTTSQIVAVSRSSR